MRLNGGWCLVTYINVVCAHARYDRENWLYVRKKIIRFLLEK